jgi:hypothetical protein
MSGALRTESVKAAIEVAGGDGDDFERVLILERIHQEKSKGNG